MPAGRMLMGVGSRKLLPPAITYTGPYHDDFAGAAGSIAGRSSSGLTWAINPGAISNTTSVQTSGDGNVIGGFGTSPGGTFALWPVPSTPNRWATYRLNPLAANASIQGMLASEVTWVSAATWRKMQLDLTITGGAPSTFSGRYSNSGTSTTTGTSAGAVLSVPLQKGDTIGYRKRTAGAAVYWDLYHKGRLLKVGTVDLAAAGVTFNGTIGFRGDLQGSSVKQITDLDVGDPDTMAMISIDRPCRVAQMNANGSVTLRLDGDYSQGQPAALYATLYNAATEAVVTAYTGGVAVTNLTFPSAGRWKCTVVIAAADLPAVADGYLLKIERRDITGGGSAFDYTGIERQGEVCAIYGQSLGVGIWNNTQTGLTPAGFTSDGSNDSNLAAADIDRRYLNGDATRATSKLMETFSTLSGLATNRLATILGGKSATYVLERVPGHATGIFAALIQGVQRAGDDCSVLIDISGHYEATDSRTLMGGTFNSTQQATYKANMQAIVDALEAETGRTWQVILTPLGSLQTTGKDVISQSVRRITWELTQDYPTRYFLGAPNSDLQHLTNDVYHPIPTEYLEHARRLGYSWAKVKGFTTNGRLGPRMISVARIDAETIDVTFALEGAGSIAIVNTTTDKTGGLGFATSSAFSSLVAPTGVSVVNSTKIRYTFPTNSFPGTAYIRAVWGANPFNLSNNATINNDFAAQASMVCETYTSERSIPVQPYYNASGDYISAS